MDSNYVPWPKYRALFLRKDSIPEGAANFSAMCVTCKKSYATSTTSSGNLRKHLKKEHPDKLALVDEETTPLRAGGKRQRPSHDTREMLQPSRLGTMSQEEFDKHLLEVIIESKLPFQILERSKFKGFLKRLAPGRAVFCRKTARVRLASLYEATKNKLVEELAAVEYVGTTADAWKSRGKGYLGVTAHWLNPQTLERRSAALCCRRIRGRQTYDVIATMLSDVFIEFGIEGKVSSCVTDNGSNFCKAFREFTSDDDDMGNNDSDIDEDSTDDGDELLPLALSDIFDEGEQGGDIRLPPHRRCASHTLNLVATKDLDDYLARPSPLKHLWGSVMAKCRAFWNKQKRSTVAQDIVKEQLGKVLPVPNATRWNSLYDAVREVVWHYDERRRGAIRGVCRTLKVEALTVGEVEFLQEYENMMAPLANTLDLLQGEKRVSIGYLLPALHNLLARYRAMNNLRHCQPLVGVLISSIKKRFGSQLWDRDLVVAACMEPMFRLDWIPATVEGGNERVHQARAWLDEEVQVLADPAGGEDQAADPDDPEGVNTGSSAVRQLFSFLPQQRPQSVRGPTEDLHLYITGKSNQDQIVNSKYIKKLFIKHNTCLPSSASAERLFSHAGLVLNPRRTCLGDTLFDSLVFLGVNQEFV